MQDCSPKCIDQVFAVLLDEDDYFTGFYSFAGIGQCKTIRTVDQITVRERLICLTSVLQDDAGLIRDFLVGTLEEVG